jgi:hypothetical protein
MGWTAGVQFSVGVRFFFLRNFHTGTGASLASYPVGKGALSPVVERSECEGHHSHPSSAEVKDGLVMWDLWWTKGSWGMFSPRNSVSPANLHSTNFSTITLPIIRGWYNRPVVAAVPKVPQHKLRKKYCHFFLIYFKCCTTEQVQSVTRIRSLICHCSTCNIN